MKLGNWSRAVMTGGNWTKELDPFSNSPIITDIDPSTYPTMETIGIFPYPGKPSIRWFHCGTT